MINKIAILMATYNGEKYISEQIQSIINQSFKDWDLFIRDDGSVDKTVEIIKSYVELDSRIHFEHGDNLGSCQNFAYLLEKHQDYRYYMFSDQDDVWISTKIDVTFRAMQEYELQYGEDIPMLIYCDREYVDQSLKPLSNIKYADYSDTIDSILSQNHIGGCAMLINSILAKRCIPIPKIAVNHDYWIVLYAVVYGKIFHIKNRLILYRQHEGNFTGGINQYSIKKKWKALSKTHNTVVNTFYMNYYFCCKNGKNAGNKKLDEYRKALESFGIIRLFRLYKFGYRLHRILGTIRAYLVLLIFINRKKLILFRASK